MIASLPGRPVALADLVTVALERSLALQAERLVRDVAEADAQVEGGLFDPTLALGTRLAQGSAREAPPSRLVVGSVGSVLPWGTELSAEFSGGSNPDLLTPPLASDGADLALTLRQPLLRGWNVTGARWAAARHLRDAARWSEAYGLERTLAEVETLYWSLAEAEAVEAVLQRSWEVAEALASRNRQLAERQLMAEVDVITAESGALLRRAGLIQARRERVDAAERLVFAVWGAGATERLLSDPETLKTAGLPPTEVAGDALFDEAGALEARADVRSVRAVLAAAEETHRRARSLALPALSLDGAWGSSGRAGGTGAAVDALGARAEWSLGLTLSMPVGNRARRGEERAAQWDLALRGIDLTLVENGVRREVREASRAVRSGQERLEAAEEAARLARAQLDGERRRLELGLGDSFRLLQTEEVAVRAELEAVQARHDLARALTRLRLARGEIRPGGP